MYLAITKRIKLRITVNKSYSLCAWIHVCYGSAWWPSAAACHINPSTTLKTFNGFSPHLYTYVKTVLYTWWLFNYVAYTTSGTLFIYIADQKLYSSFQCKKSHFIHNSNALNHTVLLLKQKEKGQYAIIWTNIILNLKKKNLCFYF